MSETNKYGLNENAMDLIFRIFRAFPEIDEVILFGSRADGSFKPYSDIDFALKGEKIDFNLKETIWHLLQEGLYLPYNFDVLNYASITNEKLKNYIDSFGVVFYKNEQKL